MKRKTNLFYTTGPDSKFLTFSNYTESLTGNFISTDYKLFPSKFLCMNLENFNEATKPSFIKLITAYYENKLAVLRDDCLNNKKQNCENLMLPLTYLIECLLHIKFDESTNSFVWDDRELETIINEKKDNANNVELFNYVGDISEEDYDGTYSDIICLIDLNTIKKGSIHIASDKTNVTISNSEITNFDSLYGWTPSTNESTGDLIDIYDNIFDTNGNCINDTVKGIVDVKTGENEGYYTYGSFLEKINIKDRENVYTAAEAAFHNKRLPGAVLAGDIKKNGSTTIIDQGIRTNYVDFIKNNETNIVEDTYTEKEAIEYNATLPGAVSAGATNLSPKLVFNIIIPLYDLVNINYKNNTNSVVDMDSIELQKTTEYTPYNTNVPLGMWLSTVPVELEVDKDTMMSPSWSLLISSQFKALPYYSKNLFESGASNQKVLESSNTKMYNTFASVIVRQNKLIDMFTTMQMQILDLQKRLELIQNQVSTIGTNKNIDSLHVEQTNFESDIRKELNNFKQEIQEYFKNMVWKATI